MKNVDYWVEKLTLQKHPEGGFFRETYRSGEIITNSGLPSRYNGERNFATAIYYLLAANDFSAFHRIKSDETWHFYQGYALELFEINRNGKLHRVVLGANPDAGMQLQYTVKASHWFAARVLQNKDYALVGCTVAPGFDFSDFEMASIDNLTNLYPQHKKIITQLCR